MQYRRSFGATLRLAVAASALAGLSLAAMTLMPRPAGAATVSSGAATAPMPQTGGQEVHATVSSSTVTPSAAAPLSPMFGNRYYLASSTGQVWPLGDAPDYGSLAGTKLNQPIIGITAASGGHGYWLVASDGGVFGFGRAVFHGSTGSMKLVKPVVGLTSTPDGRGYWLFAADGGVFSFGDAGFYGSTGNMALTKPIVGMASTPDGRGYWLFGADGGIFSFGDAGFYGSTGNMALTKPIVGMASTPDGRGYWLVGADGGLFSFGDAPFDGSLARAGQTVAQVVADPHGTGYWEVTHDGDVYPFGSASSDQIPTIAVFHTILGPADQAMEWAMAQIGKPYQWGGTGPDSFDCSGLVMDAWKSVGVTIPRVAADQYDFGTHVAISQLQIGDLVFWASNPAQPSTIEHVAMYIGGGHMVEAPHTGALVQTNWIEGPGFVETATRP